MPRHKKEEKKDKTGKDSWVKVIIASYKIKDKLKKVQILLSYKWKCYDDIEIQLFL